MTRLLAAIAVFLSVAVSAYSQEKVVVKGVITSAEGGLPLIGAAVLDEKGNGVVSDLDGTLANFRGIM